MLVIFLAALLCAYMPSLDSFRHGKLILTSRVIAPLSLGVQEGLALLEKFDKDYIERMKLARTSDTTPKEIEFKRAQELMPEGIRKERESLQQALKAVSTNANSVILGIKAESGAKALTVLKSWVSSLSLPRGQLRAVDENNDPVDVTAWDTAPVYIKYNSSDSGDAYMKPYNGKYFGVLFQPVLMDKDFIQYGDLPLNTCPST